MSVEAIARKWHDQFLSTVPVDHIRAEAALRAAYRAADMPEPAHVLWCSSPIEAVWSALVLIGKDKDYNHAVFEDIERSKAGKGKIAEARARVAAQLAIGEDEVEGYFGQAFYRANGTNPVEKKLREGITPAWLARAEASNDFLAPHKGGPFKQLHDLEQALHFEGYRSGMRGSLFNEALSKAGGAPIAILGGRSAQHRLYGNLAFIGVAIDEALAEAGKFEPSELQRAIWGAYEACGMWWPCDKGVVCSDRPVSAELTPDGPRLEWADGFTVGGNAEPKAVASPSPPAARAAPTAVAAAELPRAHAERIRSLRAQAASLPLLDRYLAGEHEQVWKDLAALGPRVLEPEHAADALAVAYETMERVDQNVRTLIERLKAIGYRFVAPGAGSAFFGFGKPKAHDPHVPPPPDIAATLSALEEQAEGPLPLSLRAFFDVVGEVNLNGDHPAIAPLDGEVTPDPLTVCGAAEALACLDAWDDEELIIAIAPDALHKANVSGDGPYLIRIPAAAADVALEDEPHDVSFVEYLRIAILGWGGFPGWEDSEAQPTAELEQLRSGLIPF